MKLDDRSVKNLLSLAEANMLFRLALGPARQACNIFVPHDHCLALVCILDSAEPTESKTILSSMFSSPVPDWFARNISDWRRIGPWLEPAETVVVRAVPRTFRSWEITSLLDGRVGAYVTTLLLKLGQLDTYACERKQFWREVGLKASRLITTATTAQASPSRRRGEKE